MTSPPRMYFPTGKPPSSGRKLQRIYSSILPNSNTSICHSIASFTRTLLEMNLQIPSDDWMQPPSPENQHTASNLPESILLHPIDLIPSSATIKVTQTIPPLYRTLLLHDLKQSGFPGSTFAWDQPWEGTWNAMFSKFILKHWQNANDTGAFKAFHIDPTHSSNHSLQAGVLHRWFIGRKDGLRLGKYSPERIEVKKKSQKKSKLRLQVSLVLTPLQDLL